MKNLHFDLFEYLMSIKGVSFAEIFFENTITENITLEDSQIEDFKQGIIRGIGIRFTLKNNDFFFSTTDLNLNHIIKNIDEMGNSGNFEFHENIKNKYQLSYSDELNDITDENKTIPMKQKKDTLFYYDDLIRKQVGNISQCTLRYMNNDRELTLLSNITGLRKQRLNYTTLVAQLISHKNNELFSAYEVYGGLTGYEVMDNLDNDLKKLAVRLKNNEKAKEIQAGNMPVIISAEAGGTLIHEAIGHSLEADLIFKGMSQFKNKQGRKIFPDDVNIIDDAGLKGRRGSFHFDDEGTPGQKTVLVENGVLKNFLSDMHYARELNIVKTGNGRRQDFSFKPIPRMSNTILLPAHTNTTIQDLIEDMKKGILVKKVGGGQVDTLTGIFIFEISEGYYVNKGRIQFPIKHAVMMGNSTKTLNNIDGMCADIGFGIGTCGKDGQGVPVSDAQTTILIKSLTIGGSKN